MKKWFVFFSAGLAYVAALNLTAYIADQGYSWSSVFVLAALMVGTTYVVDKAV